MLYLVKCVKKSKIKVRFRNKIVFVNPYLLFGASKSEVAEGPINTRELNIRLHSLLSRAENHKEFVTYESSDVVVKVETHVERETISLLSFFFCRLFTC